MTGNRSGLLTGIGQGGFGWIILRSNAHTCSFDNWQSKHADPVHFVAVLPLGQAVSTIDDRNSRVQFAVSRFYFVANVTTLASFSLHSWIDRE